ncbi:hydrolase [Streptomyces sp. MUSC 14]|uniref:HAD family hydrolase n=1 Tax=Streptomyces sp. MUSC 14 TaxID=1354889 RepID=UPI0008F5E185|nr:HAD family hydrolase [Streptomyces sp. MUSC 14]OIJ96492.1 hydrolase [Streptomyces sp. MUSC 14]
MLALFDLDNTLIDRQGGLDAWAGAFARSRGLPDQAAALVTARLRDRAYPEDFDYLRDVLRLADGAEDLWREYVDGVTRSVRCFPGVLEGLQELRREGWTLGIATNGAVDIQRAKLDVTGLTGLFDGVAISEGVGARKPEHALFDAAAAACGVPLSAGGWLVGDNPATDIAGAQAAGLRTAWVAGGREWAEGPREPDLIVSGAAEAIAMLRS